MGYLYISASRAAVFARTSILVKTEHHTMHTSENRRMPSFHIL
jgi:hypothetical protein